MSVLHDQSGAPVSGSKASTSPCLATTNSLRPESALTMMGVFQASRIPGPATSLARLPVQSHQRLALHTGVDDHQVLVEQGRGGGSPATGVRAHVGLPKLLALVVKGEDPGLAEERVDSIRVSSRRIGRVAVVADAFLFRQFGRNGSIPYDFTRVTTQGDQVSLELVQATARLAGHRVPAVAGHIDVVAQK